MKSKLFLATVIVTLLVALMGVSSVEAVAYGTNFTTSITYQNVGADDATVTILFYSEADGTPIPITRPTLAPLAGTSVFIGGLGDIDPGFKGSAVMQTDQPLVATLVQVPPSASTVKNRPLSNGFSFGTDFVQVPTVLKNTFETNSIVTVQNVDTEAADLVLNFVPTSGSPIEVTVDALPAGAAKFFDLAQMSEFGSNPFNGSLQVTAYKAGTTEPGAVVATAVELSTTGNATYAFEGAMESGTTIYMPSALCKYNGVNDSAYAVQNTSGGDVDVTVRYSGGVDSDTYTLAPGAKRSFNACNDGNANGYIGSATIEADGGNIVAVGKIYGGGLSTAFLGAPSGGPKIALPYIRWTESQWLTGTRQRAFIAIQNVGAPLAAGDVVVKYYDKNGDLVGEQELGAMATGQKLNSNASVLGDPGDEFGYYTDGTFGGSAVVESTVPGAELVVVVRIQTYTGGGLSVAEDYNGIPIN